MLALLVAILSLLLAIFLPTCPKMFRNRPKQSPRCLRHLFRASQKFQKSQKNLKFFNVFRFPTHLLKSLKNAPRTAPEAPKLSFKWQSWRYHAPSWRYHGPSWRHHGASRTQLDAILAPPSIILRPSSPQLHEKFPPKRTKDPKNRTKSARDPSSLRYSLILDPSGSKFV